LVDGGNDVEVSIIASGNLMIDGSNDSTNLAGVRTYTNKVPNEEDQTGTAYICLVSENGSVNIVGAVDVEAHGKEETVAVIHICADGTIYVDPLNGRVRAVAKTSSEGTADAQIRMHAGSEDPDAITVEGDNPIRLLANTSGTTGSSIGPYDFADENTLYDETSGGSHVFLHIANAWLEDCPDCPTPPDLLPPIEPPQHSPIAVDDFYDIDKGDALVIILDADGVLGGDYDPDEDTIIVIVLGGRDTSEGGWVVLDEDGGFTYTPPDEKLFDEFGSDGGGDYGIFTDTFTYQIEDEGGLTSNQATVTITSKNYIPVAQPDCYESAYGTPLSPPVDQGVIVGVNPAENGDYDPDPGDVLTPYLQGDVMTGQTEQGGTITLNPDGSFTYTPPAGYSGPDSFTYYVTDGYNDSESVQVTIDIGLMPPPAPVPYIPPTPGLEREVIETSGCPALVQWAASELATDESQIQIWIANSLASGRNIQPCNACEGLKEAARILKDEDGSHLAALAQVITQFASSDAPPSEEQMASIADAIANDIEGNLQYAAVDEYLDALAKYVGILTDEMGLSADQAVQYALDNYIQDLAEEQNMGVASFVAARLAALGSS
jgi:hypothetical protein